MATKTIGDRDNEGGPNSQKGSGFRGGRAQGSQPGAGAVRIRVRCAPRVQARGIRYSDVLVKEGI